MNITLNTSYNPQAYRNNNSALATRKIAGAVYSQPTFTAATNSKFLDPFKKAVDKSTDWLAKNYTARLYQSRLAKMLANQGDRLGRIVNHMQVAGSVIISGMYMTQTLRNQQLDEDRKKTLAINQGLTFLLSTVGSYLIDDALDGTWEKNVSLKYAKKYLGEDGKDLAKNFAEFARKHKEAHQKGLADGTIAKGTKFRPATVLSYIEKHVKAPELEKDLKGLQILKSLVVFGTVYRFISPVAVTPIATWISNKFVHKNDNSEKKSA